MDDDPTSVNYELRTMGMRGDDDDDVEEDRVEVFGNTSDIPIHVNVDDDDPPGFFARACLGRHGHDGLAGPSGQPGTARGYLGRAWAVFGLEGHDYGMPSILLQNTLQKGRCRRGTFIKHPSIKHPKATHCKSSPNEILTPLEDQGNLSLGDSKSRFLSWAKLVELEDQKESSNLRDEILLQVLHGIYRDGGLSMKLSILRGRYTEHLHKSVHPAIRWEPEYGRPIWLGMGWGWGDWEKAGRWDRGFGYGRICLCARGGLCGRRKRRITRHAKRSSPRLPAVWPRWGVVDRRLWSGDEACR
uniref:Uncharacterized protein n=1 Tax=Oryza nivara TaxID=4536 RepID=A0A0E0GA39_ORYNI